MKKNKQYSNKSGMSIVEIILASAIISISVISISIAYGNFVYLSTQNTAKIQAALLLDEGVEAIKVMRGESWSNIASTTTDVSYYLTWINSTWRATTTPVSIDGVFIRTFTVSPVYRDNATFNILNDTSGILDIGTKKVDISVVWNERGSTTTRSTSMYVFNLYE